MSRKEVNLILGMLNLGAVLLDMVDGAPVALIFFNGLAGLLCILAASVSPNSK